MFVVGGYVGFVCWEIYTRFISRRCLFRWNEKDYSEKVLNFLQWFPFNLTLPNSNKKSSCFVCNCFICRRYRKESNSGHTDFQSVAPFNLKNEVNLVFKAYQPSYGTFLLQLFISWVTHLRTQGVQLIIIFYSLFIKRQMIFHTCRSFFCWPKIKVLFDLQLP